MFLQKLSIVFLIIRICLPSAAAPIAAEGQRELPEYSEYLRQLKINNSSFYLATAKPTTFTPTPISSSTTILTDVSSENSKLIESENSLISDVLPPLFELCKDRTDEENSFIKQAICWTLFTAYLMVIVSLVIHQICSMIWLRRQNSNGQQSDNSSFADKRSYRQSISGMLRQ